MMCPSTLLAIILEFSEQFNSINEACTYTILPLYTCRLLLILQLAIRQLATGVRKTESERNNIYIIYNIGTLNEQKNSF